MGKWFILTSVILATTPPVQAVVADHPIQFGGLAVGFAVLGGLAVQHRQWIDGKTTVARASSEVAFSAIAGFVAFWIVARHNRDQLDLCLAALLCGMAGRPLVVGAQRVASQSVLNSIAGLLGGAPHDSAQNKPEANPGPDPRHSDRGDARDGGGEPLSDKSKQRPADGAGQSE